MRNRERKLTASQIITLGFAGLILLGSLLLMLPAATKSGISASFADALFTATSAVCVTGLVVQDTATYWSGFGQGVILVLIQIGGMGVVTVAVAISYISGKKITLRQRSTLQEAISAPKVGGIVRLTGFIVKMTLCFELVGAAVMAPVFFRDFGIFKGIWYAVFHSVSAFCNAGFDLMGSKEAFSSLTGFSNNLVINITIMLLIIIGGIGFLTWDDIKTNHFRLRRYRMQSKLILVTTALLIILPAVYFFFVELESLPMRERVLGALFQAVTPRTAGFNTLPLSVFSEAGIFIMILLMLIGGSPGSTAGGMKTTTFGVLISSIWAVFRKKEYIHFFGRRVGDDTIRRAVALLMLYLIMSIAGSLVISVMEDLPLLNCLFETASAAGTVGLTLGITPQLGLVSRSILILLMYFGRVGGLTLIFAAQTVNAGTASKLPVDRLTVG